jgi:hypothetical protein
MGCVRRLTLHWETAKKLALAKILLFPSACTKNTRFLKMWGLAVAREAAVA